VGLFLPRVTAIVLILVILASPAGSQGAAPKAERAKVSPTAETVLPESLTVESTVANPTPTEIVDQGPTGTAVPTSTVEPTPPVEVAPTSVSTATTEPAATEEPTPEPTSSIGATSTAVPPTAEKERPSQDGSPAAGSPVPSEASETGFETLTILGVDKQGHPVTDNKGGACFSIEGFIGDPDEDGEYYIDQGCDGDDGGNDGTTTLEAPVGGFGLYERRSPTGYFGIVSQGVLIVAGGPNEVTVPHEALQTLTVLKVDEQGNPLTDSSHGACFRLNVPSENYYDRFERKSCDADDGANDGTISLESLTGTGTLTEVRAPDGYFLSGGYHQPVKIVASGSNQVTVTNFSLRELTILKVDENGNSVTDSTKGACFATYEMGDYLHPHCDSNDGANDGKITLPVAVGKITLIERRAPSGYRMQLGHVTRLTITPDGPNEVAMTNLSYTSLTVVVVDEHGDRLTDMLTGACFRTQDIEGFEEHSCDADDGTNDGVVKIRAVLETVELIQSHPPAGYFSAKRQTVAVSDDSPNKVTVVNYRQPSLTIVTVDGSGKRVTDSQGGACFKLPGTGNRFPVIVCDADDGVNDGKISAAAAPGNYYIEEIRAPSGYTPRQPELWVGIRSGVASELTSIQLRAATLIIHVVDPHGKHISSGEKGACFSFDYPGEVCDAYDGSKDGRLVLQVAPGFHDLAESVPPDGFDFGGYLEVFVEANAVNEVTFTHIPFVSAKMHVVNANGDPITDNGKGACIYLSSSELRCDADDGANDGKVTIRHVLPGPQNLYQPRAPLGYLPTDV
jgi:hypothetical protein